jgi:hypothetical protein
MISPEAMRGKGTKDVQRTGIAHARVNDDTAYRRSDCTFTVASSTRRLPAGSA